MALYMCIVQASAYSSSPLLSTSIHFNREKVLQVFALTISYISVTRRFDLIHEKLDMLNDIEALIYNGIKLT